jgi:hypothetical protein
LKIKGLVISTGHGPDTETLKNGHAMTGQIDRTNLRRACNDLPRSARCRNPGREKRSMFSGFRVTEKIRNQQVRGSSPRAGSKILRKKPLLHVDNGLTGPAVDGWWTDGEPQQAEITVSETQTLAIQLAHRFRMHRRLWPIRKTG